MTDRSPNERDLESPVETSTGRHNGDSPGENAGQSRILAIAQAQNSTEADAAVPLTTPVTTDETILSETAIAGDSSQQKTAEKTSSEKTKMDVFGGLQSLVVTIIIALFIITFIAQAFQIPSQSMENTLLVGDYLLVDKVQYGRPGIWSHLLPYGEIRRNDIIVFHYPVEPEKHFVKRVVAIPGDHVYLHGGRVYVNEVLQPEPFAIHTSLVMDPYRDEFPNGHNFSANINAGWWRNFRSNIRESELVVPADHYFVLGDNRDDSLDSRYWGFVPRENIVGRPLIIYFSHVVGGSSRQPAPMPDGKLAGLAHTIQGLAQSVRWNRALHVIR